MEDTQKKKKKKADETPALAGGANRWGEGVALMPGAGLGVRGFYLPRKWLRQGSAASWAAALVQRYGLTMERGAESAWMSFAKELHADAFLGNFYPGGFARRPLRIFAFAQDAIPEGFAGRHIDVAEAGLDGKCEGLYALPDVTGLDFRVMAMVCSQKLMPGLLREAIAKIESGNLDSFAFACHGATHRSVAACVLLAAMAYPDASICLTTRRTRRAAEALALYA